jgi:hypothetical protein
VGGLAHYLEREGLATTQISLIKRHTETIKPPRALWVSFELGRPFGEPNNPAFQHRVLTAALELLNERKGPILNDYTAETTDTESQGPWACPIDLSVPVEDLSAEDKLIKAFKSEMNQLRNWYDIAVAKRARTTVGVSGVDVDHLADFISAFLTDKQPKNPDPDHPLAHSLNLATDDLKAFYTEAVTAQPGSGGNSSQLLNWFYGQTAAGRLLYAIKDKGIRSEDKYLKIVAGALIIPTAKPQARGSDGA